ncbi:hypothetical protein [Pseudophaeobacter sp. TrK17]|uniref:hypothetical protein n=1 Tax=Pseudophaeobacter sp. TrK17 TaxID=2815167 RepID=UPI0035CF629A
MIVRFFSSLTIPNGFIRGASFWNSFVEAIAKPMITTAYKYGFFRPNAQRQAKELLDREVIVSLTTYGKRVELLPSCLESIFRQTVRADRIVLWLARDEFDDATLPVEVTSFVKRGLEVKYSEDLRSHKKYWTTMQEWPDAVVITLDDDTFYPENTIEELLASYLLWPKAISCHRAHQMRFLGKNLLPYVEWNFSSPGVRGPSNSLVPIGVGGVLYPPGCLAKEVLDATLIRELCFAADDLWLKVHAYRANTLVVKVRPFSRPVFSLPGSQSTTLTDHNVLTGMNDEQLERVLQHFGITFSEDSGRR